MDNMVDSPQSTHGSGRLKWVLLLIVLLLSALTYLAMRHVDRFGIETEQLLEDPGFLEGDSHWNIEGSSDTSYTDKQLKITNNPGASNSVFQNVVVDTPAFYRFSYDAGVNEVVPTSPEEWALASIAVIYRDEGGERTSSKMITMLSGTEPSTAYTEDLLLTESIASIDFAVRLYRAGGEFFVSNPIMSRLEELALYKGVRIAIVVAWLLLTAVIVFFSLRVLKIWHLLILAACGGAALVGTMMPEALMTVVSQKVAGLMPESFLSGLRTVLGRIYTDNNFAHAGTEVSKLGHFVVFAFFGLFAGLLWRKYGIYFALAAIAVLALATEALQTMVYGRTTSVGDLVVDTAGGLTGLLVGVLIAELIRLMSRGTSPQAQPEYVEEENFDESNRHRHS